MECYYINLKKDTSRNKDVVKQLSKINDIQINRFEAIDGKSIMKKLDIYNDNLSNFTKLLGTPKIIGCGLSHILLAKQILKSHGDNKNYYLICEDDIIINDSYTGNVSNFLKETVNNINNIDENWDIIKLHSITFKLFDKQIVQGSAACYLVSLNGLKKLSKMNLQYHIDIQINNGFNVHDVENDIFHTLDNNVIYGNDF